MSDISESVPSLRWISAGTHAVIEVNPRHVAFYGSALKFGAVGPERMNSRVQAPAVLVCASFADHRAETGQIRRQSPDARNPTDPVPLRVSAGGRTRRAGALARAGRPSLTIAAAETADAVSSSSHRPCADYGLSPPVLQRFHRYADGHRACAGGQSQRSICPPESRTRCPRVTPRTQRQA
ncbi:MAG: N-acyl amino acid synthase FeeM domain-containing protein [Casimicrobiaceae bacterium]